LTRSFSFAHLADVHLGAYSRELRELNLQAFLVAMDRCVARKVDFVLIAGDLFHINVPDLAVVDRAAAKLREVKEAGIPVYVWYGSHDYSPTEKSIIDVLASSGLFVKVARVGPGASGDSAALPWTTDPSTGAKIVAVAGKAQGLDRHIFSKLDKAALEGEGGFKIFGYHAGIREFLPAYLAHIEAVNLDEFPRGFDYYAGGHIHHYHQESREGFGPFVNPGPTFGSDGRDLLNDEPRGFVVARVTDGRLEATFEAVDVVPFLREDLDVGGMSAQQARSHLEAVIERAEVDGKAVVLRVHGELASGRRAELDLDALYTKLPKDGARAVHIVKAYAVREGVRAQGTPGAPQEDIERRTVEEHVASFASTDPRFSGRAGVELALALKRLLSGEPPAQRGGKNDFEERLRARALEVLDANAPVRVEASSAAPPAMPPSGADRRKSLEEFH
jgi:DNA repair exonuclease SbcCD nuclease subunit